MPTEGSRRGERSGKTAVVGLEGCRVVGLWEKQGRATHHVHACRTRRVAMMIHYHPTPRHAHTHTSWMTTGGCGEDGESSACLSCPTFVRFFLSLFGSPPLLLLPAACRLLPAASVPVACCLHDTSTAWAPGAWQDLAPSPGWYWNPSLSN